MTSRIKNGVLILSLCLCASVVSPPVRADAPPTSVEKASAEMATAAKTFLASLSPQQLATAGFEFKDAERMNWHFIPKPRKGLTLKDMSDDQRVLAKTMLASGLSQGGNAKVLSIMSLEQVLHDFEKPPAKFPRDPELYYWSIFGQPGGAGPWGWRVEGHHTSVNFTVVNDKAVAAAPVFLGTNPAEVREGPKKGLRVLAEEEDMGRSLVKTLSEDQMKMAVIMQEAPKDVVTAAERQVVMKKFEGLPYGELQGAQKAALMELIGLYANRLRPELAQSDLKRIAAAGVDKIYFAWAGSTDKGQGHYYRIHGPTFLIEYDCTQNNANHVHSVWRDLENDFGGDVLRRHYEQEHMLQRAASAHLLAAKIRVGVKATVLPDPRGRNRMRIANVSTLFLWAAFSIAAEKLDVKPTPLFNGQDLTGWTARDKSKAELWSVAATVAVDPKSPKHLVAAGQPEQGKGVLVARLKDFQGTDLMTAEKFGDFTLHVEFFLPKDGNSGIFLMGLYELQVTDSFGIPDDKVQEGDAGGIPFFKRPLLNASGKPGEWQTYDVVFRAPRFDAQGKKTSNAKIVRAFLNGKVVQENLELPEPTGGGLDRAESPTGPLMLQGNESPVAYRNISITPG